MATIFYADSAGTQGTGTGVSAANAATLKECIENDAVLHTALVADSIIYCKNGTTITYDRSAGAFASPTVDGGSLSTPVRVVGYASTIGDDGVVAIQDTGASTVNVCFSVGAKYWHYENLKLIDVQEGWDISDKLDIAGHFFRNIEVDGFLGGGIDMATGASGDPPTFINCYFHDGTGDAVNGNPRGMRFINCSAINNTGDGFDVGGPYAAHFHNCLAHKNGGIGFRLNSGSVLVSCVSNQNTGDGYYLVSAHDYYFVNCGSTSNGGYGINGVSGAIALVSYCGMNPTNETNTSGKSATIVLLENNELTGDPDYTDSNPATPTDVDLGIPLTSAWKATGVGLEPFTSTVNSIDAGVAQRVEPVAGGGGGGTTTWW